MNSLEAMPKVKGASQELWVMEGIFVKHVISPVVARVCEGSGTWKEDDRYGRRSMEEPGRIFLCFTVVYSCFYRLDSGEAKTSRLPHIS